jgi:FkbM family methyltransferase
MYCRDVYLRTGLTMPTKGWVIDLGANMGLFAVWAARNGASVLAVEAQEGFAPEIRRLAAYNQVSSQVHVEIAVAGGAGTPGSARGDVADDHIWAITSHGGRERPADRSIPDLMAEHGIERVGLMKMDIEGGEFAVLADAEDLTWLTGVDQLAVELHGQHGDTAALIGRLYEQGFTGEIRDNAGAYAHPASETATYGYFHR